MGPLQDYAREHLVATDTPIAVTRHALYQAAMNLQAGVEPPALSAATQRVRAASVILDRSVKAEDWAKEALIDSLARPVWTV